MRNEILFSSKRCSRISFLILVMTFYNFINVYSQESKALDRTALSGNWGGARDSLSKSGVTIKPRVTFFYQGTNVNQALFSGKADLKATFNGKKIGLPKWSLVTQLEQNFGNSINNSGGMAIPQNTGNFAPGMHGSDSFDISSLYFIFSPSSSVSILLGKLNMIEIPSSTRFLGGAGLDGFMNPVFCAAPTGIIPPYILGSIVSVKTKPLNFTFMVFDAESVVNKSGFESPFKDLNLSASAELPVKIAGKPGSHTFKVVVSSKDGQDLYHLNDIELPIQDSISPLKKGRYFFSYSANQYLVQYGEGESGWGAFLTASISDGNPNAIYTMVYFGLGGNSFIRSRKQDRWGLGYYNIGFSDGLVEYANTKMLYLGNETAYSFFYNVNLTPWFSLGADFQYGKPILKNNENVFTFGLRSRILI